MNFSKVFHHEQREKLKILITLNLRDYSLAQHHCGCKEKKFHSQKSSINHNNNHFSLIKEGPEQKNREKFAFSRFAFFSNYFQWIVQFIFFFRFLGVFFLLLLHRNASNADWKAEEAKNLKFKVKLTLSIFSILLLRGGSERNSSHNEMCFFISSDIEKVRRHSWSSAAVIASERAHKKRFFSRFLNRGERQRNTPEREKIRRGEENKVFFSPSWEWKEKSLIKIPALKLLFEWRNFSSFRLIYCEWNWEIRSKPGRENSFSLLSWADDDDDVGGEGATARSENCEKRKKNNLQISSIHTKLEARRGWELPPSTPRKKHHKESWGKPKEIKNENDEWARIFNCVLVEKKGSEFDIKNLLKFQIKLSSYFS